MSDTIVGSLIGVAMMVIINIVVVAFLIGRISQKVDDLVCRVDRIEHQNDKV